jgi:hypothetical protein
MKFPFLILLVFVKLNKQVNTFVHRKNLIEYSFNIFFCLGMAGFDPYANRPNLSKWKMRTASYLNPYYEEANEIVEIYVAKYNKKYGKPSSKI